MGKQYILQGGALFKQENNIELYAKHNVQNVHITENKENSVFKDGIGVKGLRFKLHGNHHGNHGLWTLVD